jgi:DNA-binding IclR family transcriptional regulator
MSGTSRTQQRTLKELVEAGYLERDDSNPMGYKLIKGRFEEFQGL